MAGLTISSCAKKEESNNNTILGLLLLDQISGNCVTITKNSAGTVYTATGSLVPKGGCNAATLNTALFTSSASEVKTGLDSFYDGLKAVLDKYSACSDLAGQISGAKNGYSEANLNTAKSGLTDCTNIIGSGQSAITFVRIVNNKVGQVYLCKDEATATSYKANNFRYVSVSSVATDMAAKLTDIKKANTNSKSGAFGNGWSDAAIAATRAQKPTELSIQTEPAFATMSLVASAPACRTAILADNKAVNSYLAATVGKFFTTEADASAVTEVLTNSLQCSYGSGFTEVTTEATGGQSTVQQKCPASYPSF